MWGDSYGLPGSSIDVGVPDGDATNLNMDTTTTVKLQKMHQHLAYQIPSAQPLVQATNQTVHCSTDVPLCPRLPRHSQSQVWTICWGSRNLPKGAASVPLALTINTSAPSRTPDDAIPKRCRCVQGSAPVLPKSCSRRREGQPLNSEELAACRLVMCFLPVLPCAYLLDSMTALPQDRCLGNSSWNHLSIQQFMLSCCAH